MGIRILVADTETTGFPPQGKVVEVCWWEINEQLDVIDKKHSRIDPGCRIPAAATAIHGISDLDIVGCPSLDDFMAQHLRFRQGDAAVLICHNVPFDIKFLGQYLPHAHLTICTLALSRKYYPNMPNHKLGTMVAELGLEAGTAHSADGDVAACHSLLRRIAQDFNLTLEDMAEQGGLESAPETMPFGKHKGKRLEDIPKDYLLWLRDSANLAPGFRKKVEELCSQS